MMVSQTIRWQQRFDNYRKALAKLSQAVELFIRCSCRLPKRCNLS